jgi:hypothetical protein
MENRICRDCDAELHEFSESCYKGLCRGCYNHRKSWYYKNTDNNLKQKARIKAYRYKKSGLIKQEPCKWCGNDNAQMHHGDYSWPTLVVWMCVKCHSEFHGLERRVMCG